ncbi:hypothetical protein MTO96_026557 [Rhipicephalus appendiculatus]
MRAREAEVKRLKRRAKAEQRARQSLGRHGDATTSTRNGRKELACVCRKMSTKLVQTETMGPFSATVDIAVEMPRSVDAMYADVFCRR